MIGKQFGKLTVVEKTNKPEGITNRYVHWKCRCECGKETIVTSHNLRSGNTKSCGCITKERMHKLNLKTGGYKSRLYRIWIGMKTRCSNHNIPQYKDYGGRGIGICDEWKHNFKNFRDWAISNGYKNNLSIERINNDGNYEPSNCKWGTLREQNRNRRTNNIITFNGKTQCALDWAIELEMNPKTLFGRFHRGWSIEKTLTTPVKHK